MLIGLRDRDNPTELLPSASAYHIIVDARLAHGDERAIDQGLAGRLAERFHIVSDPGYQFTPIDAEPHMEEAYLPAFPATKTSWYSGSLGWMGKWTSQGREQRALGGFYPVAHTGFVVGVESGYDEATRVTSGTRLLMGVNLGFLFFLLGSFWYSLRKAAQRRTRR